MWEATALPRTGTRWPMGAVCGRPLLSHEEAQVREEAYNAHPPQALEVTQASHLIKNDPNGLEVSLQHTQMET